MLKVKVMRIQNYFIRYASMILKLKTGSIVVFKNTQFKTYEEEQLKVLKNHSFFILKEF